jgi:hemerythrin-like metal-binding protein
MATMEWKDSYSVGETKMDDQHKGLIVLINQLGGEDEIGVREVLEKLQEYVDVHFRDEEALLEKIGYPDLDKQKVEHETFAKWFGNLPERRRFGYNTGADSELSQGLVDKTHPVQRQVLRFLFEVTAAREGRDRPGFPYDPPNERQKSRVFSTCSFSWRSSRHLRKG